MACATILVADDDRNAQQTLETLLTEQGYTVVFAANGHEALERLQESHPDLCVLDIDMPRLSGMDVCRKIKSNNETKLLPVIMLTGLSPDHEKQRAFEAGCDDFLTKPLQPVELLTRIKSLLRIKSLTDALEDAEVVLFTLARTIEAKDRYTMGHADRVARYAVALGRNLGLDPNSVEILRKGGILHDIGKLGIPDAVLQKEGPLDANEWDMMRKHTLIGCEICGRLKGMKDVLPIIRNHHERLDGTGYPDGLKKGDISDLVRIVNVVDIYDALTSRRSYKEAFSPEKAFRILWEEVERGWWDHDILKAWENMVHKHQIG
ncbi:MAG: response regulator [Elusimicrobia bacterium]|nr:response regulator [Elusimicrobiota bacterium]